MLGPEPKNHTSEEYKNYNSQMSSIAGHVERSLRETYCRRGFLIPRTIALPITLLYITRTPHSEDRLFSSYSKESLRKKAPKNNQDAHDKHASMRTTTRTCTIISNRRSPRAVRTNVPKGAHTCQKGRDNILPHEKNASSPEDGREENKTRRQTGEKEIKCEQHTHADTQGQNSRIP